MTMADAWSAGLILFALWLVFAGRASWTACDNPRVGAIACFVAAVAVIVGGAPGSFRGAAL